MKRVVRWVGIAITAAAAATMLLVDAVLAKAAATALAPPAAVAQTATRTTMQQPESAFAIPVETGASTGYKDGRPGSP